MTQEELDDLIALGEGFTTELKRSGSSNLGREICAFANATGGVILIGVANDGTICGVADHKDRGFGFMGDDDVQTVCREGRGSSCR
jgi:predicted HTH transcriptional regulator